MNSAVAKLENPYHLNRAYITLAGYAAQFLLPCYNGNFGKLTRAEKVEISDRFARASDAEQKTLRSVHANISRANAEAEYERYTKGSNSSPLDILKKEIGFLNKNYNVLRSDLVAGADIYAKLIDGVVSHRVIRNIVPAEARTAQVRETLDHLGYNHFGALCYPNL